MVKRTVYGILTMLMAVVLVSWAGSAYSADAKFDGGRYDLKGDLRLLQEMQGNLNDDAYEDTVRLIGLRVPGDSRYDRFWLEVQDGYAQHTPRNRRPAPYLVSLPGELKGYNPTAELADFTAEQADQVFLTFDATVQGPRWFAVIQIRDRDVRRDAKFLFDSRTMERALVSGSYMGKYLVNIRIVDTNTNFTLDVSKRKAFYEQNGIYGRDGKILRPHSIGVTRYEKISIGPDAINGVSMLVAQMGIYGYDDTDRLATVKCTLVYDRLYGVWRVAHSEVIPEPDIAFMKARTK